MGKTRTDKKHSKSVAKSGPKLSPELAPVLLQEASVHLQSGQPDEALKAATKALKCLAPPSNPVAQLPALELIGEIEVERGQPEQALLYFIKAANLDPDASLPATLGGGADKFLWLAQLSQEGGQDSITWFEKGCTVLRREINEEEAAAKTEEDEEMVEMKKQKLANALCGAAEVYMTDLSWEQDAEAKCETLVTEACMVAPESPEPLQTLASVRISQLRTEEAQSALTRSLELWQDLPMDDPDIPDFPTRISLARLLMEATMEDKALEVLERLVAEDDSSIEAWYLGGWCMHLSAEKQAKADATPDPINQKPLLESSRKWLLQALRLYNLLDYEDERLQQHAQELVTEMNAVLGPPPPFDPKNPDDEDDEWEDADGDEEDDEMEQT